ncbi:hypothetical protein [Ktedonobacter robiniae]|uniref:Deoxynucleoside kinase domain-containing protein n=1 Tax=Ktedonobacter robiniae TaxID=2778365 RepID=A0ABQ3UNM0_9CHLR|nr:hypothetical protein [Ktedonobacter robiniae]GHO53965.1 hypothetical protein KSB_24400 [Ktedonobacter robiniae]
MDVKVFVLGRPGSGKTTAMRRIHEVAHQWGVKTTRVKDYDVLYEMFLGDERELQGRFRRTDFAGFDVLDMTVFDDVLKKMGKSMQSLSSSVSFETNERVEKIITIEFARDDYQHALKNFDKTFLQDAYFFFVEADLETCMRRIRQRITFPMDGERPVDDCHFISDYIMQTYYHKDCEEYVLGQLARDFDLDSGKIIMCRNEGSLEALLARVDRFMEQVVPALSVVGTK